MLGPPPGDLLWTNATGRPAPMSREPPKANPAAPMARGRACQALPTAVGNTRAASTYRCPAANNSATPYDCAAAVNATTVVAASTVVAATTAILIVRITIAASVVTAAPNRCAANNGRPSNGRSTTINRCTAISATAPNCRASIGAAASDGPSLSLQSLAVYRDTVWKE